MKYVTASEARRNWFSLLDEAIRGEEIAIRRDGRRLVLKLQDDAGDPVPTYRNLLELPEGARAETWSWEWAPDGGLRPRDR